MVHYQLSHWIQSLKPWNLSVIKFSVLYVCNIIHISLFLSRFSPLLSNCRDFPILLWELILHTSTRLKFKKWETDIVFSQVKTLEYTSKATIKFLSKLTPQKVTWSTSYLAPYGVPLSLCSRHVEHVIIFCTNFCIEHNPHSFSSD